MNKEMLQEYLNKLNAEQLAAATLGNESAVILAAAGSGKTTTLTTRISFLHVEKEVPLQHMLAVTFTNKAAREMKERLRKQGLRAHDLWIGTFHGICNKILQSHAKEANLKRGFSIMDSSEQETFFKRMLRANGYDPKNVAVSYMLQQINGYKEVGWRSDRVPDNLQEKKLYELYDEACQNDNVVDFAELMLRCYEMFQNYPEIADMYADKFKHILVDEFQDTNELQYRWLKVLASKHKCIFAVGDDDQCLVAGTKILTPNGERNIEDLSEGDIVIAKAGNKTLEKKIVRKFEKTYKGMLSELSFSNGNKITATHSHTWFGMLSKKYSPQKFFVYLMYKKGFGYRIGTSRVHSKGQDLTGVYQRCQHESADKQWIVGYFNTEEEARFHETKFAAQYGLLTIPFVARKGKVNKVFTVTNNQELLNKIFSEVDTENGALKILNEKGLDVNYPHFVPRSRNSSRYNVTLTLCGSVRDEYVLHTLEFYTNNNETKELLDKNGFNLTSYDNGEQFRLRITSKDFSEIERKKESIVNILGDVNVIYKANFDGERYSQLSTNELIPSMIMVGENGEKIILEEKNDFFDTVKVYDIDVEDVHNFYANGVLSHNSIYGFRGAKPENMNLLKRDFNAKTVKIEKNYRSEANILGLANGLIARNTNRQGKNLVATMPTKNKILTYQALNNEEEASFVAGEIKRLRRQGINYKDMAILYRTNSQSRAIEKALNSYNIPYIVFGGFRFFDRQEVKHAMAYLRLAYDSNDNLAFLRVVNTPARAIGDSTVRKLEVLAQEHKVSLFQAIDLLDVKTSKKFENFINLVNHLKAQTKDKNLVEMVKTAIIDSGLENMYETDPKEGPERLDNLYELISAADVYIAENPKSDITEFLAFSSLESDVNTKKRDENADVVKMMTVHSSKGLEFEVVFIVGIEQGMFPHANSLKDRDPAQVEEERRLMYVALTRAKHHLYLSFAEERRVNGITERFPRSQFWKEFDPNLLTRLK